MENCKKCGLSFNANDMKDGLCKDCELLNNALKYDTKTKKNIFEVTVVDVQMPFLSMVIFMIKWVLASIPAFLILFFIGLVIAGIAGGILGIR